MTVTVTGYPWAGFDDFVVDCMSTHGHNCINAGALAKKINN